MKSTGEVLGLGESPEEAVAKVLPSMIGSPLPRLGPEVSVGFLSPTRRSLSWRTLFRICSG